MLALGRMLRYGVLALACLASGLRAGANTIVALGKISEEPLAQVVQRIARKAGLQVEVPDEHALRRVTANLRSVPALKAIELLCKLNRLDLEVLDEQAGRYRVTDSQFWLEHQKNHLEGCAPYHCFCTANRYYPLQNISPAHLRERLWWRSQNVQLQPVKGSRYPPMGCGTYGYFFADPDSDRLAIGANEECFRLLEPFIAESDLPEETRPGPEEYASRSPRFVTVSAWNYFHRGSSGIPAAWVTRSYEPKFVSAVDLAAYLNALYSSCGDIYQRHVVVEADASEAHHLAYSGRRSRLTWPHLEGLSQGIPRESWVPFLTNLDNLVGEYDVPQGGGAEQDDRGPEVTSEVVCPAQIEIPTPEESYPIIPGNRERLIE